MYGRKKENFIENLKATNNYQFSAFYSYSQNFRLLFILSELEKQ